MNARGTCTACGRRCILTVGGYPRTHDVLGARRQGHKIDCMRGTWVRARELRALEERQHAEMARAILDLVGKGTKNG